MYNPSLALILQLNYINKKYHKWFLQFLQILKNKENRNCETCGSVSRVIFAKYNALKTYAVCKLAHNTINNK